MPADSIFDDPITNLLSTLCSLTEIISSAHAKGGKSRNDFKLGTFTSRVPSDGAASMAVKELRAETGLPVAYLILPLHMPALFYLVTDADSKYNMVALTVVFSGRLKVDF